MNTVATLAKMIDHTILHPMATTEDLRKACEIAIKYQVASLCVKPYLVRETVKLLQGTGVKVSCVTGFPAGNSRTEIKVLETSFACLDGATEVDVVINIAKALEGDWEYVENEIKALTATCHKHGAIIKVIFEVDYISSRADIIKLCEICSKHQVDFVKTSTGFGYTKQGNGDYNYTGATIPILQLMKEHIGPQVKIKASGGIRSLDQLLAVQSVGCERSGATATVAILEEANRRFGHIEFASQD